MKPVQIPFDLPHRAAHGVDDFWVAPCNQEAVAWIDRWPDWSGPALILYGPAGSGKTHLGHVWQSRSQGVWLPTQDVNDRDRLRQAFADNNCLILDRADTLWTEPRAEENFFHLYQWAKESGGFLLLLAEQPPTSWPLTTKDVRSRLLAAPTAALKPPDDTVLSAVCAKLFSDRQVRVDPDVVDYLMRHGERSFESIRQAVASLDRAALASHRRVTVALARSILQSEPKDS